MTAVSVPAKVNLALVVGARRADGLHELATVMQRIDLSDELELEQAGELRIDGFPADTLVRAALVRLAREARVEPGWRVRIEKRVPLAAGLGGGSADAGAALALANETLSEPLSRERLRAVAASVGADVPFFLEPGPKLAESTGEALTAVNLPQDYTVLIALPRDRQKRSTAGVYSKFDELGAGAGFERRRERLLEALAACRRALDLAALPRNDLAAASGGSPLLADLRAAGAFRADVSGAGPAIYGLFEDRREAEAVARRLEPAARVWVTKPVW